MCGKRPRLTDVESLASLDSRIATVRAELAAKQSELESLLRQRGIYSSESDAEDEDESENADATEDYGVGEDDEDDASDSVEIISCKPVPASSAKRAINFGSPARAEPDGYIAFLTANSGERDVPGMFKDLKDQRTVAVRNAMSALGNVRVCSTSDLPELYEDKEQVVVFRTHINSKLTRNPRAMAMAMGGIRLCSFYALEQLLAENPDATFDDVLDICQPGRDIETIENCKLTSSTRRKSFENLDKTWKALYRHVRVSTAFATPEEKKKLVTVNTKKALHDYLCKEFALL